MLSTFERTHRWVVTTPGAVFNYGNVQKFQNSQNVGGRGSNQAQKFLREATFGAPVGRTKSLFLTVGTAFESS